MKLTFIGCLLFLMACAPDKKAQIESSTRRYDQLIIAMNPDSIASIYALDGKMGDIAGRDSIRKFLSGFVDVHVLECESQSGSIVFEGDSARQEGTYRQKVVVKTDTLNLKGQFFTTWINDHGKWYIQKMVTKPIE